MSLKRVVAYQTSNDSTHVKDTPEPGEISSLLAFKGIRHHDSSLCGPQETRTDTQKSTCKDVEASNTGMNRGKQADGVDTISNSSKCQGHLNTESVDESSTEETEDCEGTVQSGVLFADD